MTMITLQVFLISALIGGWTISKQYNLLTVAIFTISGIGALYYGFKNLYLMPMAHWLMIFGATHLLIGVGFFCLGRQRAAFRRTLIKKG